VFLFWFALRLLITTLVSSNSSSIIWLNKCGDYYYDNYEPRMINKYIYRINVRENNTTQKTQKRSSNTNPTKSRGWTQVLRKSSSSFSTSYNLDRVALVTNPVVSHI
jgi:hypothetical protein